MLFYQFSRRESILIKGNPYRKGFTIALTIRSLDRYSLS